MPNFLRVSMLTLGGILLSSNPFAAAAQSCNRYGAETYTAPSYPAYPAYVAPYSGYYDYNSPTYTVPGYGAYGYYSGHGAIATGNAMRGVSIANTNGASTKDAKADAGVGRQS